MLANTRPIWLKRSEMTADDWSLIIRSVTMCALALITVSALCACLFFKTYAEPAMLLSIVGLANFILGYLAGKRNQASETTTTTDPLKTQTQQTNS